MSNPFELLKVEGEGSGTPAAFDEKVAEEEQVDWLRVVKPAKSDVHVRVTEPFGDMEHVPSNCSLMAVSNCWNLVFIGTSKPELLIFDLDHISKLSESPADGTKANPKLTVTLPGRPQYVRLAMGDKRVLVGCLDDAGVVLFDVKQLLQGSLAPIKQYTDVPSPLVNLLPNPSILGGLPHLALALSLDALQILDLDTELKTLTSIQEPFSSIAWSVKGRQFVVGKQDGTLQQYAPDGSPKASVSLPDGLRGQGAYRATSISWIENDVFLVTYGQEGEDPEHRHYLIHRQPKSNPARFSFTLFQDVMGPWGMMDRKGDFRHTAHIKGWGDEVKHLVFLSTPPSADIACLYTDALGDAQAPDWKVALLDETARPAVPMNDDNEDTTCLGLEVDLTNSRPIKQEAEGGIAQPDLPAAPRLMEFTNDGVVVVYDVMNSKTPQFSGMVRPQDLLQASSNQAAATSAGTGGNGQEAAAPTKSKLGTSAFGSGPPTSGSKPAFGFGQAPTKLPVFGGRFGSTSSGFGASKSAAAPAFGSSSAFGSPSVSGTSTPKTEAPASTSAFGKSTFGSSTPALGSTTPAFGSTTPAFGSTTPAFGSSAFGSSTPTPAASSTSAFGGAKSTSAFGSTAFGGSSTGSAFGASSAFGPGGAFGSPKSTPTTEDTPKLVQEEPKKSAFGSASAFGSGSAFGSASPFGQKPATEAAATTTKSPFGGSAFGARDSTTTGGASKPEEPKTPAFGSSPFAASTPGQPASFGKSTSFSFGSLSKSPASSPTTDTKPAFGTTAFGSASAAKPAFGSSSFGSSTGSPAPAKSAFGASAFGSSSGFAPKSTQELPKPSAFGQSSSFGAFAGTKPSPLSQSTNTTTTPAAKKKADAFSFGNLGLSDKTEDEKLPVKKEDEKKPVVPDDLKEVTGFSLGELDDGVKEAENQAPVEASPEVKVEEPTVTQDEHAETVDVQKEDEVKREEDESVAKETTPAESEDEVQEVAIAEEVEEEKEEVETPTPAPSVPKGQTALGFGRPPSQPSSSFSFAKQPAKEEQPSETDPAQPSSSTSSDFSGEIIKTADIPPVADQEAEQTSDAGTSEHVDEQEYDEDEVYSEDEDGELVEQEDDGEYERGDEDDEGDSYGDYDEDEEEATEDDERRPSSPAKRQRQTEQTEPERLPQAEHKSGSGHARTPSGTHVREVAQQWEDKAKNPAVAPPSFFQSIGKPHSPASQQQGGSSPMAPPPSLPEPTTSTIPTIQPATLTDTPVRPNVRQVNKTSVTPASGLAAQFTLVYNEVEKQLQELRMQAEENAAYHIALSNAPGDIPSRDDIALADFWYFGALDTLASYTKEIAREAGEARQQGAGLTRGVKDMVAGLHKIRQRSDDCARYLKAFNDPGLRRALRQRPLSSQQADEQKDLRRAMRGARDNLFRAEIQLATMKRKAAQNREQGSSGPISVEDVTKEIKSLEIGLRERQDDLEALSRRIDSLTLQKTQSRSRPPPLSGLMREGEDEPVRLVSEAMNAELDGDLLLRAVKANRSELDMAPRPAGKSIQRFDEESKGKGKFIGSKAELRRPRPVKPKQEAKVNVDMPSLVIPPVLSTSTPQAGPSNISGSPTSSLFSRPSPSPTPAPITSTGKSTFGLPANGSTPTFSLAAAPSTSPMQGFDFGLTPSTSGLNSRAGYRPMNKHQREKVEAGSGSGSVGKKGSAPIPASGSAGGGTINTAGGGFGSNFFAMPPSGQAAGSKKSDPNETGTKPTFNFGLARK